MEVARAISVQVLAMPMMGLCRSSLLIRRHAGSYALRRGWTFGEDCAVSLRIDLVAHLLPLCLKGLNAICADALILIALNQFSLITSISVISVKYCSLR